MKSSRIFLGATLLVLLVVVGGAVGAHTHESQRPFTLAQHATHYDPAGKATPVYVSMRRSNAAGGWMEVQQYSDGHTRVTRSEPDRGVFFQQGEKDKRIGEAQAATTTETDLRKSPSYLRDEVVLGSVRVGVVSVKSGESESELWCAYDFDGTVVKIVRRNSDGSYFVLEPDALTE